MNEKDRKKREWVKTAAIVFLTVMLVLTFFSNTIQNWSLPEVATQYVQSGTITAKIRGTGTVESTDPYEVKVTETRTVASVAVIKGMTVQKGDILLYLEGKDSKELESAKQELEAAQNAYDKALLSDKLTSSDIWAAQQGVTAETYRTKITVAQNAVKNAQDAAKQLLEPKQAEVDRLQLQIKDFQAQVSYESSLASTIPQRVTVTKNAMDSAVAARDQAQKTRDNALAALNTAKTNLSNHKNSYQSVSSGDAAYVAQYKAKEEELQNAVNQREAAYNNAVNSYNDAKNRADEATREYNNAVAQQKANESSQSIVNLNDNITRLEVALYNAKKELEEVKLATDADIAAKQEELNKLVDTIGKVTGLQTYLEAIEKAQAKVDELTASAGGSTITAPISGTISEINVKAGNETSAAVPVIVMQPEDRGYTLSFSVTNDQARRVSVGDVADLVNAWRYDNVIVTLANIKPDTSNPGQNKLLTFNVTGNVTAGQTLNLSVGQKSANYEFIVPNSAIREDNNGKFILIVESKPSPLGTRYTASRVDVQVIASDETQSAISAALKGYEFVITTSNKPVEAGDLVRLPD